MTAVFVHGVPETPLVWQPLVDRLDRDDIALLRLPGFGEPLPEGFELTKERYARWLAGELARFEQVDLVAHDWGALLSLRVLADQPANVRSWVMDVGDLGDDFRWHGAARTFQTTGEGEALIAAMVEPPAEERASLLEGIGIPAAHAAGMAGPIDATMGAAILGLYRSAVDIGTEWGPGLDRIRGRGLVVCSVQDPFRDPERARRLAARTGAELVERPANGHFWMLEDPDEIAALLARFWSTPT